MIMKRFEYKNHKVYDNLTGETHSSNMVSVNVLNELHEENEQLKSKYSEQCTQLDFLKDENQHMRNLVNENEQLKKNRFICLDCEHSGYVEIGCLCEYNDYWQDYINKCEDFKELRE